MSFKWNPYQAAVQGQGMHKDGTFCLSVQGQLCEITIEDLPDITDPGGGAGFDGSGWDELSQETGSKANPKIIKRKKITVTAVIEGKEHKKTLIVEDKNITIDNVEVDIIENKKTGPELKVRILL